MLYEFVRNRENREDVEDLPKAPIAAYDLVSNEVDVCFRGCCSPDNLDQCSIKILGVIIAVMSLRNVTLLSGLFDPRLAPTAQIINVLNYELQDTGPCFTWPSFYHQPKNLNCRGFHFFRFRKVVSEVIDILQEKMEPPAMREHSQNPSDKAFFDPVLERFAKVAFGFQYFTSTLVHSVWWISRSTTDKIHKRCFGRISGIVNCVHASNVFKIIVCPATLTFSSWGTLRAEQYKNNLPGQGARILIAGLAPARPAAALSISAHKQPCFPRLFLAFQLGS